MFIPATNELKGLWGLTYCLLYIIEHPSFPIFDWGYKNKD